MHATRLQGRVRRLACRPIATRRSKNPRTLQRPTPCDGARSATQWASTREASTRACRVGDPVRLMPTATSAAAVTAAAATVVVLAATDAAAVAVVVAAAAAAAAATAAAALAWAQWWRRIPGGKWSLGFHARVRGLARYQPEVS